MRGARAMTNWGVTALALLALTAALGCAAASPDAASARAPGPGERLWRAKCGACHARVEPGARPREQLELALARHRKRVRLSEPEWRDVIEFLAAKPVAKPAAGP